MIERTEQSNYPRLTGKLLALSVAEDYEDAKLEWRITGRVWRDTVYGRTHELVMEHPSGHPGACLCGHPIVYHFEIENTDNNVREIVGSTCINNWMVLRHMSEVLKIPKNAITEEMIEEWKKVTVQGLIRDAFWESEEGEDFKETFEELRELDLRINVRDTGKTYFDEMLKERRPLTVLRKSGSGKYGSPNYTMASIVWRWNHPDNVKNQQTIHGYPNDRLLNDLTLFDATIDSYLPKIEKENLEFDNRKEYLERLSLENKDKLRNEFIQSQQNVKFEEMCTYYGFPLFTADVGLNQWERTFLSDMRGRFISEREPTEKQCNRLISILFREQVGATDKQKAYLRRLGHGEDMSNMTKIEASSLIDHLLEERK